MARMEPLDDVHPGRNLLHLSGIDQRGPSVVYAALAADLDRRGRDYSARVLYRLHRQSLARLERLGLQRDAGQPLGADLSAVLCAVAAGGTGWNRHG